MTTSSVRGGNCRSVDDSGLGRRSLHSAIFQTCDGVVGVGRRVPPPGRHRGAPLRLERDRTAATTFECSISADARRPSLRPSRQPGNLFGDTPFRNAFVSTPVSTDCGTDVEEGVPSSADVRRQLRDRADAIRREQTERAVRELASEEDLSPVEREAVEQLGVRLTEAVLARPEAVLHSRGAESARSVATLFDLEAADD